MRRPSIVSAALGVGLSACAAPSPTLVNAVRTRIAESDAEVVGFYFHDLAGDSLLVDADVRMHAASTMKVPVMIQLFRDAETGRLGLDDHVDIRNTFHSIMDGSEFSLSPADDSDSTLYERVGEHATVRELIELMITVSSNLATNMLIELADARRVTATMRELGADSIEVLRGVEDIKAYEAGRSNTTTARDLGIIFSALAEGRAASVESTREILDVLGRQHFNEGIPAGLPADAVVAHKTGNITAIHHDAALVTVGARRYVLVVLVRGIEDMTASASLMADLSRIVYRHVME